MARREKVHSLSVDQSTGSDKRTQIKMKTDGMCIRVERHVQIQQSVKCCSIKLHLKNAFFISGLNKQAYVAVRRVGIVKKGVGSMNNEKGTIVMRKKACCQRV